MVTVSASHFHRPGGLLSMKSARENMDVIAAYQQVGTYRGAAAMCGTTHKTVKRIIGRAEAGGKSPDRAGRGHNYDLVAGLVPVPVRAVRGQRAVRDDAGDAGRVLRGTGRSAEGGSGGPDGLPEGRRGREQGGADRGLRPVRD